MSPVQQTIISVTYLIGLIHLLCSKVDLPRLPLLWKLLSEAPEMRQSFLCSFFARNKSSGCSQVCFFSSSLTLFLAMPGSCTPGIFQQQCFMYQYCFQNIFSKTKLLFNHVTCDHREKNRRDALYFYAQAAHLIRPLTITQKSNVYIRANNLFVL